LDEQSPRGGWKGVVFYFAPLVMENIDGKSCETIKYAATASTSKATPHNAMIAMRRLLLDFWAASGAAKSLEGCGIAVAVEPRAGSIAGAMLTA